MNAICDDTIKHSMENYNENNVGKCWETLWKGWETAENQKTLSQQAWLYLHRGSGNDSCQSLAENNSSSTSFESDSSRRHGDRNNIYERKKWCV